MYKGCYTFNELKEKYKWETNESTIQRQIRYARRRGVEIEKAFKEGKTYFKLISDFKEEEKENNELYTFKEIKEKFNWTTKLTSDTLEKQIQFAKNRGCIIELASDKKPHLFKIITKPLNDDEWKIFPLNNKYEVTKTGLVRVVKTKKLVGSIDGYGYVSVTDSSQKPIQYYKVHKMVMETYNPIPNSSMYVVDHINGIKNDNKLENLRWVLQRQNTYYRDENWANISKKLQFLIENKGYEWVNALLEVEVGRIKN